MSKFNIEHIYPRLDENGEDRLMFNLDGRKVSERIGADYEIRKDESSDLVKKWGVSEADAKVINTELQNWVDKNKDTRFNLSDYDSRIESKEYGIRASQDDVVVKLTKEGEKELNIKDSYKINRDAVIEYESPEFGHQKFQSNFIENNGNFKQSFYENPRHSIEQIKSHHDQFRQGAREEAKHKIENIFPGVDENGNDVLKFELNGRKVSERISTDYEIRKDETSDLVKEWGVDAADAKVINTQLEAWASENQDTRFARNSDNPLVETVEYGIRASNDGVAVFLTPEGAKELSIDGGYSIERGDVVSYESSEFGYQEFDNRTDNFGSVEKQAFYENPENSIDQIQGRHEQFREEAKKAQEAELAGKPEHYVLTWDSTDMVGIHGANGLGTMPAGEYRSKEEALGAIDKVRQEMIDAGSGDDAERDYIEKGTFSVNYVGPSEIVENIRVDDLNGQLFARFDVKTIDIKGDEKVYSTGDWIDLKDGLLTDTDSNVYLNNSDTEFDRDEVTAAVNRHLKANPISERTLDKYRAAAESEKEDEEKDRLVAS